MSIESENICKNTTTVKRDEIVAITSHVLKIVGPHFTKQERSRLALVGDLSDLIGYGDWVVNGIGCPLHQAGIPRSSDAELFYQHFDGAIYDLLRDAPYRQHRNQAELPQVLSVR